MAYERNRVAATIDDPRADAALVDTGFGVMLPFRVLDRSTAEEDPDDFALKPRREWDTSSAGLDNVEVISELKCLAPRGRALARDMAVAEFPSTTSFSLPSWATYSDSWIVRSLPAGGGAADFLFFNDGRGGRVGEKTGDAGLGVLKSDPNFALRLYRYGTPRDAPTDSWSFVTIELLGNPESEWFGHWALVLPGPMSNLNQAATPVFRGYKFPVLLHRSTVGGAWVVMAEVRKAISESATANSKAHYQTVTWETLDGHFIINIDGTRLVYHVPPEHRPADIDAPTITAGPVRLIVANAMAAVNISPVSYDASACFAQRDQEVDVDGAVFNADSTEGNSTKYLIAWTPSADGNSTTCTVTAEHQSTDGTIEFYKPKVAFTSGDNYHRAACYFAQVDFPPSLSAGTSSPYATDGNDVLVAASGSISNEWRHNDCTLVLSVARGDADALVSSWKGYNRIIVTAGWDLTGAGSDIAVHFTGVLVAMPMLRPDDFTERTVITLRCRDDFALLERKYWQHLGNFTNFQLHLMFQRVLNQCGIPDDKIQVWDGSALVQVDTFVSGGGTTPTIPLGARRGELRFGFQEDVNVIDGLNAMIGRTAAHWVWGYDQNGIWFLRPTPVWTTGDTPSWTLDDTTVLRDTVTGARAIKLHDESESGFPFANNTFGMATRGDETESVWLRDKDSGQTAADPKFVGHDLWAVEGTQDGESPGALAQRMLTDRLQRTQILEFSAEPTGTDISPKTLVELMPYDFIQASVTGAGVTDNSIFQILTKQWRCDASIADLTYHADLTAKFIE